MRTSLLPPLLTTLRRNVGRGQRDVALFELGLVFLPRPGAGVPPALGVTDRPDEAQWSAANAAVPDQPWHVAVVLTGELERSGPWGPGRAAQWADAVQAALDVLDAAGVPAGAVTVRAGARDPWHPGRCAAIEIARGARNEPRSLRAVPDGVELRGSVVGYAGELHPGVCSELDLPRRTCAMELDLDLVPLPGRTPAPVISNFPPALINVALVVDEDTPAARVERALVQGAGELLESVRLFDVYTGAQVGDGRKSLAYKLVFRAGDRTLTAEEALAARDAAVGAAAEQFGAVLRGA